MLFFVFFIFVFESFRKNIVFNNALLLDYKYVRFGGVFVFIVNELGLGAVKYGWWVVFVFETVERCLGLSDVYGWKSAEQVERYLSIADGRPHSGEVRLVLLCPIVVGSIPAQTLPNRCGCSI